MAGYVLRLHHRLTSLTTRKTIFYRRATTKPESPPSSDSPSPRCSFKFIQVKLNILERVRLVSRSRARSGVAETIMPPKNNGKRKRPVVSGMKHHAQKVEDFHVFLHPLILPAFLQPFLSRCCPTNNHRTTMIQLTRMM